MSDFESDYSDYDVAREDEGGDNPGRSDPSRGLVVTLAVVVGILVVGGIVLVLLRW